MRFFVTGACGPYGARVFMENAHALSSRQDWDKSLAIQKWLKEKSVWRGYDKRVTEGDSLFLGYELRPESVDPVVEHLRGAGHTQIVFGMLNNPFWE